MKLLFTGQGKKLAGFGGSRLVSGKKNLGLPDPIMARLHSAKPAISGQSRTLAYRSAFTLACGTQAGTIVVVPHTME